MLTTRAVLSLLRAANPETKITEDLLRSALRRGLAEPPRCFAGRFLWSLADIQRLARALGLSPGDADDATVPGGVA